MTNELKLDCVLVQLNDLVVAERVDSITFSIVLEPLIPYCIMLLKYFKDSSDPILNYGEHC